MKYIKYIQFSYLRREAHYQFLELFHRLLDTFGEVKEVISIYYVGFVFLLDKERRLVDAQKKSNYTKKIVDADHRDDQLLVGIRNIVVGALHHFDPRIVEAAISLQNRLNAFGAIIKKSYEEEAAAIRILLLDLQGSSAAEVELLGLTPWINELEIAVNDFERLLQLRIEEQATKPMERLREIRNEIEEVYRKMIDRINAFNTIEEKEVYNEFIRQLNLQIDYFNEHNRKQTSKDIKTAIVKKIPDHNYTGNPITPVPEISFEGNKLVFATDFTLSYKNNTNVGNAEITIHGKGAYKGNKIITFFISD
jgi:hypothetical protein